MRGPALLTGALAATALAAAALAGCSSSVSGAAHQGASHQSSTSAPTYQEPSDRPGTTPPSTAPRTTTPPTHRPVARPRPTVSDTPPFDACHVLSWADVPAAARGTAAWERRPVAADDSFRVDCRLDNSISSGSIGAGTAFRYFTVHVYWGPKLRLDRVNGHVRIGSTTADVKSYLNAGQPVCFTLFPIARGGKVAISVFNGRFPTVDTCGTSAHLAAAVAARVR